MRSTRIFEEFYQNNLWNDPDSRSGTGSNLKQTHKIRNIIPCIIENYRVKSLLDIPCGDFFWMKEIKPELKNLLNIYIGGDIVNEIIKANKEQYEDDNFKFRNYDIINSPLPKSDLIFCRDCLVHFSYSDILKALLNIKRSQSTYLLTTTFPSRKNRNIITGSWRPINLQKFPFYISDPMEIIPEDCTQDEGLYQDKSIALWKIKNLSLLRLRVLVLLSSVYRLFFSKVKSVQR